MSTINAQGRTTPGADASHGAANPALAQFDQLPDSAFVRVGVVRALNGNIGNTTVWDWVKKGLLPPPQKLGPQVTAWNVGQLRAVRRARGL